MKAPCKDCPDRVVGCHSACEKYKAFREEREARYKEICLEYDYVSAKTRVFTRWAHKNNRSRR